MPNTRLVKKCYVMMKLYGNNGQIGLIGLHLCENICMRMDLDIMGTWECSKPQPVYI